MNFFAVIFALMFSVVTLVAKDTLAFSPVASSSHVGVSQSSGVASTGIAKTSTLLSMGLLDAFSKAFENKEYGPPPEKVSATARHILVPTKEEAQIVMKMIANGEQSFDACAREFSTCPSASKGGSLGSFGPGTMVKEFDQVIFSPDTKIGQVMGPVLTQFGHHVIVVEKRTGGGDWY